MTKYLIKIGKMRFSFLRFFFSNKRPLKTLCLPINLPKKKIVFTTEFAFEEMGLILKSNGSAKLGLRNGGFNF